MAFLNLGPKYSSKRKLLLHEDPWDPSAPLSLGTMAYGETPKPMHPSYNGVQRGDMTVYIKTNTQKDKLDEKYMKPCIFVH